ncbi:MAG: CDP-diacylglycerol--glycerol-3-phosphate 3-phosphatidyltransferase [Legionellales bacterium]|nr:MAG: CDP-diacylglycerol--glycerol-3-phosphate 3-phosphatidyltransferase [Legionellales bacterium]
MKSEYLSNIPNTLTVLRILLLPIFIIFYYLPFPSSNAVAAAIFSFAAITDWLDGYLARKLAQESSFGAFLDPVADKLMVAIALMLLVGSYGSILLTIPAAIIIAREIIISALREWMAEMGKRSSVKVSLIGKGKTVLQMISIIILLLQPVGANNNLVWLGYILLYIAVALTIWSMFIYLKIAWKDLLQAARGT